jgi:hypothetical protein
MEYLQLKTIIISNLTFIPQIILDELIKKYHMINESYSENKHNSYEINL